MRGMTKPKRSQQSTVVTLLDDLRRRSELARFLPLWPAERADLSPAGRDRIIRLLAKALRHERRRGVAGHWAYDLARHAALLGIYHAEVRVRRGAAAQPSRLRTNSEYHDFLPPTDLPPTRVPPHIGNDIVPPPA